MGLEKDIVEAIRKSRFLWFGHIMRKKDEEGVKKCMDMTVEATSFKARRATWLTTVKNDVRVKELKEEDYGNRNKVRAEIKKKCRG